ncbi:MAG TPA: ABC transporter ATP-binding protein [Usitatibacter sp.]|nr:ABC transporter ATP-binding protein [Usitatibacter sp.]
MRIRFERVTQRYDGQPLFAGLDLEIPSGRFFTLLGPSGCGKTTLLRMLAGFVRPDAGRIWFGERDVTALPVHKRGVGLVFQDYALFPDRSAVANVTYGLEARGVAAGEAKKRAMAMLERVGLAELADRSPARLSGGQRQRVAMARALVIEPQLLLLDEPLAALDVKLRVELRAMVRELQLESKVTTVFVTHDQEEALALSDLVAVMDRGRIVQVGAPAEVYARPANGYAADFVGSANLLRAGTSVRIVRREEIEIGGDLPVAEGCAQAEGGDGVAGVVEGVEFRGAVTGYRIRTDSGLLHVDVWSAHQPRTYRRGEQVLLRLPRDVRTVEER